MRQIHPLIVIADQKWRNAKPPVRMLNLENLTRMAGRPYRPRLPAYRPLKNRLHRCRRSDVECTRPFRHPAGAGDDARGGDRHGRTLRSRVGSRTAAHPAQEIRRVMANPDDIGRYLVEFFNLAKSVKRLGARRGDERPVEFRATGRTGQTGPSMPTTSTSSISLIGCGSTLRAAGIGHPYRTAARPRHRALPHRRRAASGLYQIPMAVMNAMTSRIKCCSDGWTSSRSGGRRTAGSRPDAGRTGGGAAFVDLADRLRRKSWSCASSIPEVLVRDFRSRSVFRRRPAALETDDRLAERHHLVTGFPVPARDDDAVSTLKRWRRRK